MRHQQNHRGNEYRSGERGQYGFGNNRKRDEEGRFAQDNRGDNARYQQRDERGRFVDEDDDRGYASGRASYGRDPFSGDSNLSRGGYGQQGWPKGGEGWDQYDTGDQGTRSRQRDEQGRFDHDPDYSHWRRQQLDQFDTEYQDYQSERRKKFADDFNKWRTERDKNGGQQAAGNDTKKPM